MSPSEGASIAADFNNDSADTSLPKGVSQPTQSIMPPMDQDETDTVRFDED